MRCQNKPDHRSGQSALKRLLLVTAVLATGPAWAACTVSSTGMSFGAYQPLTFSGAMVSTDALSTGDIAITCSAQPAPVGFKLSLGPSTAGAGDRISMRYLENSNGGEHMAFNIYTDPGRTAVWGNDITGTLISGAIPIVTSGSHTQTVTVYGKIPARQNSLKSGTFTGTMTMTMTYIP